MKSDSKTTALTEHRAPGDARSSSLTAAASVRRGLALAGLQFIALVIVSALCAAWDLDRSVSALFYDPARKWFMGNNWLWSKLYQYGTIPGAILAMGCLAGWLATFFRHRLASWRPYFLLVVLTTVIAAGVLVNGVLKPYWGRPRPNQTTDFGGYYAYRNVFPPGIPGKGASFPCGHCTIGFTFLSLYFAKRRSRAVAYGGAAAGALLGGLLSAARIINGAHFLTDAIWSLGIVTISAVLLHYCVLKIPAKQNHTKEVQLSRGRKILLIAGVCLASLVIAGTFMTRRPFFKTKQYPLALAPDTLRIEIAINLEPEKLQIRYDDRSKPALLIHAHGFGWADAVYRIKHRQIKAGSLLQWQFQVLVLSYFAELDHSVEVVLPENRRHKIEIEVVYKPELIVVNGSD
jgi:lipid A 4'-phosphatase